MIGPGPAGPLGITLPVNTHWYSGSVRLLVVDRHAVGPARAAADGEWQVQTGLSLRPRLRLSQPRSRARDLQEALVPEVGGRG